MSEPTAARTVVVTGSTGDAGRAVCALLTASGHRVIALGSDSGRLASVEAAGHAVVDLADLEATATVAARIRGEFGPVDGLVHLVGGWRTGHDADGWNWLEPRLLTTLRSATLAFHDDLTSADAGRLVVVGSASAAQPTWSGANYATLKTAADAWVAAIASGWRRAGTAAAVTFVVASLGDGGTPVADLARAIESVFGAPAADLNGQRIDLRPPAAD